MKKHRTEICCLLTAWWIMRHFLLRINYPLILCCLLFVMFYDIIKTVKYIIFYLKSVFFLNFIYIYLLHSAERRSWLRVSLLLNRTSPISLLTATVTADIFLVISPLLPIRCIGIILAACQRRGFHLRGIRRRRLTQKQVSSLGKRLWSWNTVWGFLNFFCAFVDSG